MSLSESYLSALRIDRSLPVLEQIRAAVREHQRQFTFNNIEVLLEPRRLLNLEPEHLLQKIVRENRGGYCFEHNRLLYEVLHDLGLNISARLARVLYGRNVDAPRTHRVTVLQHDDAEYLIDVGFGPYTPRDIVALPERSQPAIAQAAKATESPDARACAAAGAAIRETADGLLELTIPKDGEAFTLYSFDGGCYEESDFAAANFYTSRHPDSKFVNHLIVSRHTERGMELIHDLQFSETQDDTGRPMDRPVQNEADFKRLLQERFQLPLTGVECRKLYRFCRNRPAS